MHAKTTAAKAPVVDNDAGGILNHGMIDSKTHVAINRKNVPIKGKYFIGSSLAISLI